MKISKDGLAVCPTCESDLMHLIRVELAPRKLDLTMNPISIRLETARSGEHGYRVDQIHPKTSGSSTALVFQCESGHQSSLAFGRELGSLVVRMTAPRPGGVA